MLTEFKPSLEIYEVGDLKIATYRLENTLGRPYEDSLKVGSVIERGGEKYLPLILADGATRVRKEDGSYPKPSPAKELAGLICQEAIRFLEENLREASDIEAVCREVLVKANSVAFDYNQAYGLKGEDLAGATLTIALIELGEERGVVCWASIGDSPLIIFSSETTVVNPNQLANFEEKRRDLEKSLGISGRDFSIWHRRTLRNKHYQLDGVDVGYGVLTGEEGVKDYFVSGKIEIKKDDYLLLASDGVIEAGLDVLEEVIRDQSLPFDKKLPFAFGKVSTAFQNEEGKSDDMTGILLFF